MWRAGDVTGLRVAVVYNLRRGNGGLAAGARFAGLDAEYDTEATVEALRAAIGQLGHDVSGIEADLDCFEHLRRHRPQLVFNIAEGLPGPSREAQLPALCELLGVPHTGSGVLTLALCLDKAATGRLLRAAGVPTPDSLTIFPGQRPVGPLPPFPLLVKPLHEGSSMGITEDSLVHDADALERQVRSVHEAYGEPALVDEFLPGREFTVGLLGNGPPRVLPVTEINFAAVPPGYPRIYTYRFKKAWDEARFYRCPAPLDSELSGRISDTARRAFTALGCLDVARIDLRLDRGGTPRCIDVNPLPGMAPGFSDLPRQADAAGLGYVGLVQAILDAAIRRHGL